MTFEMNELLFTPSLFSVWRAFYPSTKYSASANDSLTYLGGEKNCNQNSNEIKNIKQQVERKLLDHSFLRVKKFDKISS